MIARFLLACSLVGLCAGLTACGGRYQLGSATEPGFTTLHVAVVRNDAMVPQSAAIVTTALREAFIKDGRVRLVDDATQADAVLRVVLVTYQREMTVAQPADTGLSRRHDLVLTARATLTDRRDGRLLLADRPLTARRGVFSDDGHSPAEYQTLPLLAERLADAAVRAVLERW